MENRTLFPTEEGTPQGGIVSPTLANMTLDGLEKVLHETFHVRRVKGKSYSPKVNLVRYADDFIITGDSKELLEDKVLPLVETFLRDRGLQLSSEKTCITHIDQGFDFLGQNIRKYGGKLLIKPSRKNTQRFLEKVRTLIRSNPTVDQATLIGLLNPVIRGWANYHRHIVAYRTFCRVRMELWRSLWQWAKRRHPQKPAQWVIQRYWNTQSGKWVFEEKSGKRLHKGKPVRLQLVDPTDIKSGDTPRLCQTPIRMIRAAASILKNVP